MYIGSIKPNVGHTEGCSGLAGILKAVACLEQGMLVPTYGVEKLNPKLKLADWNLALPQGTIKWPTRGQRRISVNSFGFGGANAHAILDDAHHYLVRRGLVGNHNTVVHDDEGDSESGISAGPATPLSESDMFAKRLFVFSSKDQGGLQRLAKLYASALSKKKLHEAEHRYMEDLAYTLSLRRSHFDFRGFCVAPSLKDLTSQLARGLNKTKRSLRQRSNLLFVFTGQGAQWPGMGVQLLRNPEFEESVLRSQGHLERLGCVWNAVEELRKTDDDSQISLPEYSQTLCTVLQLALVDLLRHWGVRPTATVGHSSGEIAAAYAAGYITHQDAVRIAYVRGLSSAAVSLDGAMLAAGLSRDDAQKYLAQVPPESAVVACVNSPSSVTLSGDVNSIGKLEGLISADGKFARKLKVKTAYHSPHMKTVAQTYLDQIGHVETRDPASEAGLGHGIFMYSSLTGKLVSPEQLNADYWVSNMCAPVEFSSAVTNLLSHSSFQGSGAKTKKTPIHWDGVVELGPHAALKGPVQQIISASTNKVAKDAAYMSMISRGQDATETSLATVGKLWAIGHPIDLYLANGGYQPTSMLPPKALVDLPSYPWNHTRSFWHEAYSTRSNRLPRFPRTDLLGVPVDLQNGFEPRWKNYLRLSENPWIEDHQITGTILYPAAGMLVMALEGAFQLSDKTRTLHGFRFRDIGFERGLVVPVDEDGAVETRLSLLPDAHFPGQYQFTIFSTTNSTSWTKHCRGIVALEYAVGQGEVEESTMRNAEWIDQRRVYKELLGDASAEQVDVGDFYDHLQTIGMEYGPLFRNTVSLMALPASKASHGIVVIPDTLSAMPENFEYPHVIHPATMDAIFHLLLAAFNDGRPVDEAAVPYSISDMFVAADQPHGVGTPFHGYGQLTSKSEDGHEIMGNLIVSDEAWEGPKLTVKGFALRQVTSAGGSATGVAGAIDMKKCARVQWFEDSGLTESVNNVVSIGDAMSGLSTDTADVQMPSQVYLLLPSAVSATISALSSAMAEVLSSVDIVVTKRNLSTIGKDDIAGKHIISLLEVETPLIYSWTEAEFTIFKDLVSKADHIFWVTRGGAVKSWAAGAEFAPAQGLLRVLRNEYTLTTLPHLDLSSTFDLASPENTQLILHVWVASQVKDAEMEFAESAGAIHVPRAVDEPGFDAELQLASGRPAPVESRLDDISTSLKLTMGPGSQGCLGVEENFKGQPPGPNEVEVEVKFVGLSASGGWGKEAVGVVSRCGGQVTSPIVGQRVAVLHSEASGTRIRVDKSMVATVPTGVAPEDAATMPLAFVAAQYALLETACLRRGGTVLINAAASDMGQAAVQISQVVGATVFALVASKAEKDSLTARYGIPASHIFDSNLDSFVAAVTKATNGEGVDVVFNPRSTSATRVAVDIVRNFGFFFDLSGDASGVPLQLPTSKHNVSIMRIDMDRVMEAKPAVVGALLQRTFSDFCRRGVIRPISPPAIYLVEEFPKAIDALGALSHGKILLSLQDDATILTMPPPAPKLELDGTGTYVLAGGLGALGLDIANMMAAHGAKHLVFLSRSGGGKNQSDLESFIARGIEVDAFKCDVTDARSVSVAFQTLKSRGRVVRGVVQCAMVLEDTIFENMTHAKWSRAFLPKSRGSRNLLAQLWPADDPFFILLSSITGVIGNTAQANYASGNTFEDALANHARTHLGIRATSIDVGLVSDSSHFTTAGEFGDLDGYLNRYQHGWTGLQTSLEELRVALAAVMRGSTANGQSIPAQFVLGLGDRLVRRPGSTGFERDRKFDLRVVQLEDDAAGADGDAREETIGKKLSNATSVAEAAEAVEMSLKKQIAVSIGVSVDEVDVQRPLPEFGGNDFWHMCFSLTRSMMLIILLVDSLNAVEIRNRALKEMQSDISVFELLSATPMADLAVKIAARSGLIRLEGGQED